MGSHDVVYVAQKAELGDAVGLGGGGERGAGVDLHEPGLEVRVDEYVVAVALEAVPVVDHHALHALQAVHDHLVDALEQPARHNQQAVIQSVRVRRGEQA